jgi:hypothetical protein
MWVQVEDYEVDEDGFVGLEEGEYVRLRAIEQAARKLLDHYVALVNSGDAGNWDPETEPVVAALRAALSQT